MMLETVIPPALEGLERYKGVRKLLRTSLFTELGLEQLRPVVSKFESLMQTLEARPTPERLTNVVSFLQSLALQSIQVHELCSLVDGYNEARVAQMERANPDSVSRRRARPLIDEACALVKIHLKASLRLRPSVTPLYYAVGDCSLAPDCYGWCDASVLGHGAGGGFILRHNDKETVACGYVALEALNPFDAELKALGILLQTALSLGYRRLRVHIDAEGAVQVLTSGTDIASYESVRSLGAYIKHFELLVVHKIPRLFNTDADFLAREAASC